VGVQRDLAASGRVVVVDSEVPESGWVSIDLAGLTPAPVGLAAPSAEWGETREPWLAEAAPPGQRRSDARDPPTREPLTIARLEAWAERLRGSEKPSAGDAFTPGATTEPIAVEALVAKEPVPERRPVRGIRPEDLVAVGRKPADLAIPLEMVALELAAPEAPPAPKPPLVRPALKIVAGRSRFSLGVPSSSGVRFILLCLAAFFLSAGAVHSYGRWKHSRAVVVPATVTPGAVIT
jgi:hypothetical protein